MKQPPPGSLYQQQQQQQEEMMEEAVASVGMEVDDDPIDILADFDRQQPPVDAEFFNDFPDDFDDQDLA